MSFQPPPGNTPPPPPPGYGGAPGPSGFNAKSVSPLDYAIMAMGALVFIFSFIDFYDGGEVTYQGKTQDIPDGAVDSSSAWHAIVGGGFFAWFAMLFGIVAAASVAGSIFRPQMRQRFPAYVSAVVLFLAAVVFEIIAIFVTPGYDIAGAPKGVDSSADHGFGFWVSLVVLIVGLVVSVMRAQQTNTALPGPLNNMPKIGR